MKVYYGNIDVSRLTNIYNDMVCNDHHKDRDCHWYINKVWSYGEPPFYRVEHYGYVYKEVNEENRCQTYEEAEEYMIDQLLLAILEEYDNQLGRLKNPGDWDKYDFLDKSIMDKVAKMIDDYKNIGRVKEWILLTQS